MRWCLVVPLFLSLPVSAPSSAGAADLGQGNWSGGAGIGFMSNTPDGIAELALSGHADYALTEQFSVGPLAQYAGAGNDVLFGLSAQAKYRITLPSADGRTTFLLQGGLGFIRAGITDTDSRTSNTFASFLIPVGIGLEHQVSSRLAVTADLLLNFTSLGTTVRTGGREFDLHTNVMPALYLGVRF